MGGLSFDAVVFDADGTLFDTETVMHQIWIEVGREMGEPRPGIEYLDYVGLNRPTMLRRMAEYGPGFDGEEFLRRVSQGLQDRVEIQGVPLKPGARAILEFLHGKGLPMALATSTQRVRTDRRLELTGFRVYFQTTVTGDEVTRGKPDPQIYLLACQKLGVDPSRCLAVEDSRNGILSAHTAGMAVAMVPDMIPPTPELEALLWGKFQSLDELLAHLQP